MPPPTRRAECLAFDRDDPLAPLREAFVLPEGVIYLDGNSLGPLPRITGERLRDAVERQWGRDLIASWNSAGWIDLPRRVAATLAPLIGADADEVLVVDTTSVNLFKLLAAAVAMRPQRRVILSERDNFPTDLYIAQGLNRWLGGRLELRLVAREAIADALDEDVAVAMLTQVDYRDGSCLDLADITARAHRVGALTIWDLAHSAGALPVDLDAARADFAVGCGYKYLNGGPGATAFLYVARRHHDAATQPLSGWLGHAAPFDFVPEYRPAPGIGRFQCSSPPILSTIATEAGIETLRQADTLGGMAALRAKSLALTDLFIARVETLCAGLGLRLVTPREHARRGSQVSFAMDDGLQAYAVVQALIARGVIGDFRAPDILRFGFAPAYLRAVDAWDAAEHLAQVLRGGEWNTPRFLQRKAVT